MKYDRTFCCLCKKVRRKRRIMCDRQTVNIRKSEERMAFRDFQFEILSDSESLKAGGIICSIFRKRHREGSDR